MRRTLLKPTAGIELSTPRRLTWPEALEHMKANEGDREKVKVPAPSIDAIKEHYAKYRELGHPIEKYPK